VWQCVAVCYNVWQCFTMCCSVLQCVAVCCIVLQCVAVCCSVLQCVTSATHPLLRTPVTLESHLFVFFCPLRKQKVSFISYTRIKKSLHKPEKRMFHFMYMQASSADTRLTYLCMYKMKRDTFFLNRKIKKQSSGGKKKHS